MKSNEEDLVKFIVSQMNVALFGCDNLDQMPMETKLLIVLNELDELESGMLQCFKSFSGRKLNSHLMDYIEEVYVNLNAPNIARN